MQVIFIIDARMESYDFKNRAGFRDTYSAFGRMNKLALDWFGLSECPGSDWDRSQLLKTPLAMISILCFFVYFSNFVLPLSAIANPDLDCLCLLMYCVVY